MAAYLVVAVTYHDPAWTEAYRRDVPAMVAAHGGRYLAKAPNPERLEGDGDPPDLLAILEFPDAAAARALLASPEYQPHAAARQAGATTSMFLI
jgi:uncharacterized protein (DUF1330 family)